MPKRPTYSAARNIIAGILSGYGIVSFTCFIALEHIWAGAAPRQPNEALGLIYKHGEHGTYTYFSQFQATTGWLLFTTSIPLVFAGVFIAPRKNVTGKVRWFGATFKWDQDDPRSLMKWAALASAAVTPFAMFLLGPRIVHSLNAIGFVRNLG